MTIGTQVLQIAKVGMSSAAVPSPAISTLPMPRSVRALVEALAGLPASSGPQRLVALDHFAARTMTALARFSDEPKALVPAQRALLLLGGRPGPGDDSVAGLLAALRRVDDGLGDAGGFSRLLENAVEAGEVTYVQRLAPSSLPDELVAAAVDLEALARRMATTDDLAHATGRPAALVAGAQLACWVATQVGAHHDLDQSEQLAEIQSWISHRGASERLKALVAFEPALWELDQEVLALAEAAGVTRGLALWVLSERLSNKSAQGTLDRGDREALSDLLVAAKLSPLEVFEQGL